MASTTQPKIEDKWEVEEGARTLIKAEELKKNKKLYPLIQKELKCQAKAAMAAAKAANFEKKTAKRMEKAFSDNPHKEGY